MKKMKLFSFRKAFKNLPFLKKPFGFQIPFHNLLFYFVSPSFLPCLKETFKSIMGE